MDPVRILSWEGMGFLALFTALLVYRMLTRQISLAGLLGSGTGQGGVSPERVQLLVSTIAVGSTVLRSALHGSSNALPEISATTLCVFGASSFAYLGTKAFKFYRRAKFT